MIKREITTTETRRRLVTLLFCVALAVLTVLPNRASACSCAGGVDDQGLLGSVDIVFTGEVLSISPVETSWTARLLGFDIWETAVVRVDTLFKGDVGRSVEFTYGNDPGMCGLSLNEGSRGVFLLERGTDRLTSGSCTFNLTMDVDRIIDVLGEGHSLDPSSAD